MNRHSKAVSKYLQHYSTLTFNAGSPGAWLPECAPAYQQALVIPAFAETPDFLQRLACMQGDGPTLVILVINCPRYAGDSAKQHTRHLLNHIQQHLAIENVRDGVTFGQLNSGLDLLSLDITSERSHWLKPLQSGVGFARKVGMDVALDLWQQGRLSNPWVLNSDADAWWPAGYLKTTADTLNRNATPGKGAMVFPFRHQHAGEDTSLSAAAALYELSLRYYVTGLRWSGSPWAYHTVGSTQAIHCESYAEIRGFPVREAGEDFYLLNKIAKTAPVYCPAEPVLILSDRVSERVPFGTGPAVKRIGEQQNPEQEFLLYEPEIFGLLKKWHRTIPALANNRLNESELPQALGNALCQGLGHLGLEKALHHCQQQAKSPKQFEQHLWQWFDGFRTLKLVHWLREQNYPSISFSQWRVRCQNNKVPFINWHSDIKDQAHDMNRHLTAIETATLPFTGGLLK